MKFQKEKEMVLIKQFKYGDNILPSREVNNIPIVMSSSEEYLLYSCVTIYSILQHSSEYFFYDIILLHQEQYSQEGIDTLKRTVDKFPNCLVRLLNIKTGMPEGLYVKGHIKIDTYSRLLLPKILTNFKKVLYLDSDLIVLRDVSDLFSLEGDSGTMLSGVVDLDVLGQYFGPEFSTRYYLKKKLSLSMPETYLQAGVLVFHLDAIRSVWGTEGLMKAGSFSKLRYYDQDVLNCLCDGHKQTLDMKWNVVNDCNNYRVGNIFKYLPKYLSDAYFESRDEPWIVHYSGNQKPWDDCNTDLGSFFYETSKKAKIGSFEQAINEKETREWHKKIINFLLPLQSKRREICKLVYFHIRYKCALNRKGFSK